MATREKKVLALQKSIKKQRKTKEALAYSQLEYEGVLSAKEIHRHGYDQEQFTALSAPMKRRHQERGMMMLLRQNQLFDDIKKQKRKLRDQEKKIVERQEELKDI